MSVPSPGRFGWIVACVVVSCTSRDAPPPEATACSVAPLTIAPGIPRLDFFQDPPDPSWIALTFDDGPDPWGYTESILDTLKAKGVKATFFVNANNKMKVATSSYAQSVIKRMASEGHLVGNHTVNHYDLNDGSTDPEAELRGVDDLLHDLVPDAFAVRLDRAPYGNPYFGPQSRLDVVAPIFAKFGVHVGWDIDSNDWKCADDGKPPSCVTDNVLEVVDVGGAGVVLLHSVNALTPVALPTLIDALASRGKKFVSVEDLIVAKYKDASRHLFWCTADKDGWGGEICASSRCVAPPSDAGAETSDSGTSASDAADADANADADADADADANADADADAVAAPIVPATVAPTDGGSVVPVDDDAGSSHASDTVDDARAGCGFGGADRGSVASLAVLALLVARALRARSAARTRCTCAGS